MAGCLHQKNNILLRRGIRLKVTVLEKPSWGEEVPKIRDQAKKSAVIPCLFRRGLYIVCGYFWVEFVL